MKATGIVRKVDDLGRVVLPIELRRSLGIKEKDPLEIYVMDDQIVLRKSSMMCVFCGSGEDVTEFRGKGICHSCRSDLKS
ncbi:MAG: AbrB/MazE/SpoVT family DNA-binding domain-containing protein [Firmicutes bacterium]|nr:AbrB/MazE/SpoVT family DNA-binding domain-containing protein [Bacillota bacterium]